MNFHISTAFKLCAITAATLLITACGGGGEDDDQGSASFATSTGVKTSGVIGQGLYNANCASCHGASVPAGVNYLRTLNAIAANKGGMGYLSTAIQTSQADDIATYLAFGAVGPTLPAQTITFASPGNQTVGTATPALAATSTSGLAVTIASSTPTVCTVTNTALTLMGAGSCTLTATQVGSASFAAAAPVIYTFTVAAAPATVVVPTAQTITLTAPGNQTMGVTPAALVATSTSGLAVTFDATTPAVCTVSGTTLTLVATGSCTVTANQAGSATVAAAATASSTFTVAPAAIVGVATAGKVLYASNGVMSCAVCHGTPPNLQKVLNGANNPTRILAAITNNTGGMSMYAGKFSTQNLTDIAAYLATPGI